MSAASCMSPGLCSQRCEAAGGHLWVWTTQPQEWLPRSTETLLPGKGRWPAGLWSGASPCLLLCAQGRGCGGSRRWQRRDRCRCHSVPSTLGAPVLGTLGIRTATWGRGQACEGMAGGTQERKLGGGDPVWVWRTRCGEEPVQGPWGPPPWRQPGVLLGLRGH